MGTLKMLPKIIAVPVRLFGSVEYTVGPRLL
jgi:hypothetical protein